MKIPGEIEEVLREIGLNAAQWRRVRAAFDRAMAPVTPADVKEEWDAVKRVLGSVVALNERARELVCKAAEGLEEAPRLQEAFYDMRSYATLDELTQAKVRQAFLENPETATSEVAERLGVGKTTLFRWLRIWGLPVGQDRRDRERIAEMQAEIARMQAEIVAATRELARRAG